MMSRKISRAIAFSVFGLITSMSVYAHVDYTDLSNPLVSPGGINGGSFSNNGWFNGTTAALGDSHDLAGGTLFKFHLDQTSSVSILFSDINNSGLLNPGFSLYKGLLPDESHDDTSTDPLNPAHLVLIPFPHVVKDPSPVDNGLTADYLGTVSPFRDTANLTFNGQFDALHSWSMANESGDWAVLDYITHVAPTGGNSVSLLNLVLLAGDYTIAAGGGVDCGSDSGCPISGLDGQLEFSATTVPVPAAAWLFGSALGFLCMSKRKKY